jgi:hypothetical protein
MITQVDETVFRGPRPRDGRDYAAVSALGVKYVLSLESGIYDALTGTINYEAELALGMSMTPLRLHLSPLLFPRVEALRAAIRAIDLAKWNRASIYVHCKDGVDRTGLVCASYRVLRQRWSEDAAIEEMYKLGYHRLRYRWWLPQFRKFLKAKGDL